MLDQPSVSSQTNPHATHARKQHLRQTSRAETHDGTPADFIFLSIAPYAHRSLPNTGLMSSFAHRQPPGVSTRFLRIELDLRLCFACRLHPCSFLGGFRTSFTSNTLLFLNTKPSAANLTPPYIFYLLSSHSSFTPTKKSLEPARATLHPIDPFPIFSKYVFRFFSSNSIVRTHCFIRSILPFLFLS
jgi:hypothetical protein